MADKTVTVSGFDNVIIYVTGKVQQLGVRVVAPSDSNDCIYDREGIQLDIAKEIEEVRKGRIKECVDEVPAAVYTESREIRNISCDIALPCTTQNELNLDDAQTPLTSGCSAVTEGANTPSTREATDLFVEKKILFISGKAANVGGVAISGLEQSQNFLRISRSFEEVDDKFRIVMVNIFVKISGAVERYGVAGNYVAGANIAGLEKVVEAVLGQDIVWLVGVSRVLSIIQSEYDMQSELHRQAIRVCPWDLFLSKYSYPAREDNQV